MARFPEPAELGEGWRYVADKPPMDMGFQMTAMYEFQDPNGEGSESLVVDVKVHKNAEQAREACATREALRRGQDQVVVDKEPSLGETGFLWHHESNADFGRRSVFCVQNLWVTVGPNPMSLELARRMHAAFAD